jgi:uncharacterized protein
VSQDRPFSAMVIVAGSDVHHDLIGGALALQSLLVDAGIRTRRAVGLERFVNPLPATAGTDVFVLYTAGGALSGREQEALSELVAGGKGVVAVHASIVFASDGTEASPDRTRAELLGCRYLSHGPDGVSGRYKVQILGRHSITEGVEVFDIEDEYYHIELIETSKVEVLAQRWSSIGDEPILYVRQHGEGRVCYLSLGHDMRAWGNPGFRSLVCQAALWAGGER